ncbi:hypothetical protein BCR33DRAFT_154819 [Rhizoclosmatium globosum]|uniref:Uncharacterized protein n=1 Tax=Rhizoclosmatium globosum TaxID=329046 RepID=A0A1Y2CG65_9FUNG|nr:hypothetical protein BCR33DRAFT_154819 [Rhizoclosmatium globosum]|eukprot:ORY45907.1 hypothetical protein BCR33DRAFT_154819 [Rhizoclosmatium globosum]
MQFHLLVAFALFGIVSSSKCLSSQKCTSTKPEQNPTVDWDAFCSQRQGGKNFCELNINDCACL